MNASFSSKQRAIHVRHVAGMAASVVALVSAGLLVFVEGAHAAATVVPLGTAEDYSVLAATTVTNTGTTTVDANVGVDPGSAVSDLGDLQVGGETHTADTESLQAANDLDAAYTDAAGQGPVQNVDPGLGGETLVGGVYRGPTLGLTGTLTLDGANESDSVWVFQAGETLITASNSSVRFINGANPCNVFWQVGSSATLGSGTDFVGTIMAQASVGMQTGADLQGRALALEGAVTLDANDITSLDCELAPPSTPPTPTTTTTTTPTTTTATTPTTTTTATPTTTTTATPTTPGGPGTPNGPGGPEGPSGPGAPGGPQIPNAPNGPVETGVAAASTEDPPYLLAGALALAGIAGLGYLGATASRRPRRLPH